MERLEYLAENPAMVVLILIAGMSTLSFFQFGFDKRAARSGGRRISEATLLATAIFGGYPGAKLGQRLFRHKTRKQPFAEQLDRLGIAGLALLGLLMFPDFRALLAAGFAAIMPGV